MTWWYRAVADPATFRMEIPSEAARSASDSGPGADSTPPILRPPDAESSSSSDG